MHEYEPIKYESQIKPGQAPLVINIIVFTYTAIVAAILIYGIYRNAMELFK